MEDPRLIDLVLFILTEVALSIKEEARDGLLP